MNKVTLTNINVQDQKAAVIFFTLQDTNNNSYGVADIVHTYLLGHAFPGLAYTYPGEKINGLLAFEVPLGAKLVTITHDN